MHDDDGHDVQGDDGDGGDNDDDDDDDNVDDNDDDENDAHSRRPLAEVTSWSELDKSQIEKKRRKNVIEEKMITKERGRQSYLFLRVSRSDMIMSPWEPRLKRKNTGRKIL